MYIYIWGSSPINVLGYRVSSGQNCPREAIDNSQMYIFWHHNFYDYSCYEQAKK